MSEMSQDGDLDDVVDDNVETEVGQDLEPLDTLEDAVNALADEIDPEEEQTETETEEPEAEEAEEEAVEEEDLETGEGQTVEIEGEQLPVSEVANGYLRQQDYTRKTEQLAEERNTVQSEKESYQKAAQTIQTAYQNLKEFVDSIAVDPPADLARTDPAEYLQQKAVADAARKEIEAVLTKGRAVEESVQQVSESDKKRFIEAEELKLVRTLPGLKDPGKKAVFDKNVKDTALEFGFTADEVEATADSRIRLLVHYARLGKKAVSNQKNAARRVATKPQKGKTTRAAKGVGKNRKAMERLSKTGSFKDAMSIDFD